MKNKQLMFVSCSDLYRSRYIIINEEEDSIKDRVCFDEEEFFNFFLGSWRLIDEEYSFFLINDYLSTKLLNIINYMNDNFIFDDLKQNILDEILYSLENLNKINYLEKSMLYLDYCSYNEKNRNKEISSKRQLFEYLSYDYILLDKLNSDDLDVDKELFIASSFYLVNECIDLYDKIMINNTLLILGKCIDEDYFKDKEYRKDINLLKKIFFKLSDDIKDDNKKDNPIIYNKRRNKE